MSISENKEPKTNASEGLNPIILQEQQDYVSAARLLSLRDREELTHALGHEAAADIVVYTQSLFHITEAIAQWSVEPLINGASHFESAASTLPVIGPLLWERRKAKETYIQINNLHHALRVAPTPYLYEAARAEIKGLPKQRDMTLTPEDKRAARNILCKDERCGLLKTIFQQKTYQREGLSTLKETTADFVSSLAKEWWSVVSPRKGFKGIRRTLHSTCTAGANLAALPFKINSEDMASQSYKMQQANLQTQWEHIHDEIDLTYNSETRDFSVSESLLTNEIASYKDRLKDRNRRAALTLAATVGCANFIQNETADFSHEISQTKNNLDPISSFALTASLIIAKLLPASLTLSPLKKSADKFSEHSKRITELQKHINLLRHVQNINNDNYPSQPLNLNGTEKILAQSTPAP